MDMPGKEKRIKLKEDFENKTYAVYELVFGQPYNFYNEEQDKFIYSEPTKATLYTKEEAETVRRKLLEPRVDYYQKTGNNYQEIHVGDLFKKRILKEGLSLAELLAEVTEEIVDETSLNENSPIGKAYFVDQEDLRDAWREIEDEVIEDEGYNDEDLKDSNVDNKLYKITSDRFLTKYGKTFSDFAQDLLSKDSNNFGDFDYDTRDKEAEHDFGLDDLDPAGGYGPRSHMEEADVVRTGKGGVPLISKGDFDPKKQDKKSKIPFYAFLPKEVITKINNRFPGSIQIISKDNNLAMFISQMFYIALAGITRGRYSQDIERKKTELTSYISEIIPSFVRGLIKKNVSTAPTKIKETPMHYVDSKLIPTESKTKQISGEGNDNISIDNAKSKAMLDLTEKAKGGEIKILDTRKQKSKSTGNFRCIIMAEVQTQDGYLIPLLGDDTSSQLFQSPWEPMAKNRFTMIYIVRNLKTGQDFEFKTPEKAIEYIGKKGETPTGTPIPLKAIYKVRDNSQGITKEKDKEFDNFEEADKYFNDKTEENSLNEEMNDFIDYEYPDPELIQWAKDEGMEKLIVLNPEGGLENRDELLSALTGIENVGEKDYETYDYRKTNFTDFGSGNDLLKESKLRSIISKLIREELN